MKPFLILSLVIIGIFEQSATLDTKAHQLFVPPQILVHYLTPDSAQAREAFGILNKAYLEIADDLRLAIADTFHVFIAPSRQEFYNFARGQLPKWTGAFAVPASRAIVVKSPRWDRPETDFRATLIHELVHLLLHERVRYRPVPRWLDEGLAIFYAEAEKWSTLTTLSKAAAANSLIPLADIDRVLNFQRAKAELAYQESYSAVSYLLLTYDIEALRIILQGIREGKDVNASFHLATGSTFIGFEQEWILYVKKNYQWFWLSEIDSYIWLLILALGIIAWLVIRLRTRRKLQEWESIPESETPEIEIPDTEPSDPKSPQCE